MPQYKRPVPSSPLFFFVSFGRPGLAETDGFLVMSHETLKRKASCFAPPPSPAPCCRNRHPQNVRSAGCGLPTETVTAIPISETEKRAKAAGSATRECLGTPVYELLWMAAHRKPHSIDARILLTTYNGSQDREIHKWPVPCLLVGRYRGHRTTLTHWHATRTDSGVVRRGKSVKTSKDFV